MTVKLAKELAERGVDSLQVRVGCGKLRLYLETGQLYYAAEAGTPQEIPMDGPSLQRIIDTLEAGRGLWAIRKKTELPAPTTTDLGNCNVTFYATGGAS